MVQRHEQSIHSQRLASSLPSQQITSGPCHGTGTPPGLGILPPWDLRRMPSTQTWHRHSLSLSHRWPSHLVGAWSAGVIDPRSRGFVSEPAHEYLVRTRASRLRTLRRIIAGLLDAMRPAIWPVECGDKQSGIRHLESCWAAASDHRQQLASVSNWSWTRLRERCIHGASVDGSGASLMRGGPGASG